MRRASLALLLLALGCSHEPTRGERSHALRTEALERSDRIEVKVRMVHRSGREILVHECHVAGYEKHGWIVADEPIAVRPKGGRR